MARADVVVQTGFWAVFRRSIPLLAILAAFVWACITIVARRTEEAPPGAIVIRIGHWQLEAGIRRSFDTLAEEFARDPQVRGKYGNRKIVVIQDAIPEGIYGQWATSQMMGETAPDLVEIGQGLPGSLWLQFQTRYFLPLTDIANAPNPFNKVTPEDHEELAARVRGTYADGSTVPAESRLTAEQGAERLAFYEELARVPFRLTYTDGMRNGYQEELQEYMRVPLSRATIRMFYNQDLLKKLTNRDEPPQDLATFLQVCSEIRSHRTPGGSSYTPIASSNYNMAMWGYGLFGSAGYEALVQADFNRDGTVGSDETYAAFRAGRLTFYSPAIKARFDIARNVSNYFQTGFNGLGRDDAVFNFAQQNSVFMTTGTWDAQSLVTLAEGKFRIGAMRLPQPAPDDPHFGRLNVGPILDEVGGYGFPFGLTRFSKNPECAKDFLLFLASRRVNERMNRDIGWIPAIRGAAMPRSIEIFAPVNQGMYSGFDFIGLGGDTNVRFNQLYESYLSKPEYTYKQFVADFEPFYLEKGLADWENQQRDWRRAILNNEKFLAAVRGTALAAGANADDPLWVKYRSYTAAHQITPEIGRAVQESILRNGPDRPVGPYEFLDAAKENIRRQASVGAADGRGGDSAP